MPVLQLKLRSRAKDPAADDQTALSPLSISGHATAVIVCDMWDAHWCAGASRRVDEMAPAMDRVIRSLRDSGALIIHAPSETMAFYEGAPPRERAKTAPTSAPPCEFTRRPHDPAAEGPLPIDDTDAGCDDLPACPVNVKMPWTRQHAAIEILDADAITDSGVEVHNLLKQYGVEQVLIMGVHTNMCILARPFGIRRLVGAGHKVALVRDMTDTMYNSRKRPFVNHFRGTDLVVEHIERHWCPTITSDQIMGGEAFRFLEDSSH